jgi:hypothetical protein
MTSPRGAFQRWADERISAREAAPTAQPTAPRTPLTAGQHILHLLLTVFTGGLWAPVWFIRAWRGNAPQA